MSSDGVKTTSARELYLQKYLSAGGDLEGTKKKQRKKEKKSTHLGMKIHEDDAFIAVDSERTDIPSDEDDREDLRREIVLTSKLAEAEKRPLFKKGTFQQLDDRGTNVSQPASDDERDDAHSEGKEDSARVRHDSSDSEEDDGRRRDDDGTFPSPSTSQPNLNTEDSERVKGTSHHGKSPSKRHAKRLSDDGDASPPRQRPKNSEADSPSRVRKSKGSTRTRNRDSDGDISPPMRRRRDGNGRGDSPPRRSRKDSDSDPSPPRRKPAERNGKFSEVQRKGMDRVQRKGTVDSQKDFSPTGAESKRTGSIGTRKGRDSDADMSPPRRRRREDAENGGTSPSRRRRKGDSDGDQSPPRERSKRKEHSDRNSSPSRGRRKEESERRSSPPRRRRKDDSDADNSPPRRRRRRDSGDGNRSSPSRRTQRSGDGKWSHRKGREGSRDDDLSPLRRRRQANPDAHESPGRASRRAERDVSPSQRRTKDSKRVDASPRRRRDPDSVGESADSRHRRRGSVSESSPAGREVRSDRGAAKDVISSSTSVRSSLKSVDDRGGERASMEGDVPEKSSEGGDDVTEKTLDGKKAGLQSAKAVREEMEKFREKEKEAYENLDESVSGRNAEPVHRLKMTGKNRQTREEREKKEREAKKQSELEDKYAKWNKGVYQIDKRAEDLNEMARVAQEDFARTADNEAMNKHLKEILHAEDPMLEHVKKKKLKTQMESGVVYPSYKGARPPNRFSIAPGYRWDGVDRSNGFEAKIAQMTNKKEADQRQYYEHISHYE